MKKRIYPLIHSHSSGRRIDVKVHRYKHSYDMHFLQQEIYNNPKE
jgi:hypothetical protein